MEQVWGLLRLGRYEATARARLRYGLEHDSAAWLATAAHSHTAGRVQRRLNLLRHPKLLSRVWQLWPRVLVGPKLRQGIRCGAGE